ncbi:methyl-accepting chemotaxis sensory transducer [Shimia isoporae]|uniref:Methyl-accepting chemotaxis sensory transducer n=1 Tax=Shimia isoporae TaxID=647720 RepID=A0A4R1N871_9RHOB|nr:methyl-accepting chemotaxis protein [Shimia isoporae]TCL01304.1 methyl-accepting chemotaxis sensory transducer [Shimia isoporae]
MKDMNDLDGIRAKGVKALFGVNILLGIVALGSALALGKSVVPFAVPSLVFVLIGAWALRGGHALHHRIAATLGGACQVTLVIAAFAGHSWQMDAHMIFFAYIPMSAAMLCPASIVAAAVAALVHHLGLTFVMPSLVYPSVGLWENILRSLFHGTVVIAEAGALFYGVKRNVIRMQDLNAEKARLSEVMDTLSEEKAIIEAKEQAASEVVDRLHVGLAKVAKGNLDAEIAETFSAEYEDLRMSFNAAVDSLSGIISSVTTVSKQIGIDSTELAEVSSSVATSTEKQADALSRVTDSVEHIADGMQIAVGKAEDMQQRFDSTRTVTQSGTEVVRQAVETMDEIEQSSSQIDHVVALIEDIAFQTNLLALNAGVEAARAGEAGAGFAIVASEVRALAHRSAEAAQNINKLISQSNEHVGVGVSLVRQVGDALETILSEVNEVSGYITEIAAISNQQAESVQDIRGSMQTLGMETQGNAARSEEASASTSSLDASVEKLVDGLSGFVVKGGEPKEKSAGFRSARAA